MAYEVVKQVGRRAYRYRVESYRDPESKKVRARWTYIGPVAPADSRSTSVPRGAGGSTREGLLDAFERLLEKTPYAGVTAGAVAAEAGVAHGTFYRHFKDKRALLLSSLERVKEEIDRGLPTFGPPFGPVARERARIRSWLEALLEPAASRRGAMSAWYGALAVDRDLQTRRFERRRERVAALERYLEDLKRSGTISLEEPAGSLAAALNLLLEGASRSNAVEAGAPDRASIAGVVAVFERSIFGP
jgi:AcrR family transcriptional regulator